MVDFNEKCLQFKNKLTTVQFLTILLKKLSMGQILEDNNELYSGAQYLYFEDISKYNKQVILFNDELNDLKVQVQSKFNKNMLTYNFIIIDNDSRFKDNDYIYKFSKFLDSSITNFIPKLSINKKIVIELDEEKNNNHNFIINDPYFNNKLKDIGHGIVFFNNYRYTFIPFIISFNKYINQTESRHLNSYNVCTLTKFNNLIDLFEKEDIIDIPSEEDVNKFIIQIQKYINIIDKTNYLKTGGATCSMSIFSIKFNCNRRNLNLIDTTLVINGIKVFSENCIGTFKYISHPGLNFFIKCLNLTNNYQLMMMKIQKFILEKL